MSEKKSGDCIKYSTHRDLIVWAGENSSGTHYVPEEGQKYILHHYIEGEPEIIAAWYTLCSGIGDLTKFREIDINVIDNQILFYVKAYPGVEGQLRLRVHILYK